MSFSIRFTRSSLPANLFWTWRLKAIFFSTVNHGKRVGFWNTIPRSGPGAVTSLLLTKTVPVVGVIRPAIKRRIVDFPQPEVPTRLINSPLLKFKLMRSRAWVISSFSTFAKLFDTSFNVKTTDSILLHNSNLPTQYTFLDKVQNFSNNGKNHTNDK